ncbi:hypothetical protein Tco_1306476 [Tanacetum coccineum]
MWGVNEVDRDRCGVVGFGGKGCRRCIVFQNQGSSDEKSTPANYRSSKADGYHAVPPFFIIRELLTQELTYSFDRFVEMPLGRKSLIYEPVNKDKVIIKDWNSDDEDDVSEVQTVSPVKTNES